MDSPVSRAACLVRAIVPALSHGRAGKVEEGDEMYRKPTELLAAAAFAIATVALAQLGHATEVVDDNFEPNNWPSDYGVYHRVDNAGAGVPNPAADMNKFHNDGYTGSGFTIGVISDGDAATENAIENLIKAIAPDVTVLFESGFDQGQTTSGGRPTRANIASAIDAHRNNDVDIIVDGANYLTEPFFASNPDAVDLGQAVQNARNDDILYFAAAGDMNRNALLSPFINLVDSNGNPEDAAAGELVHNFDSSDDEQWLLQFTVERDDQASFALQWTQENSKFADLELAMRINGDVTSDVVARRTQRPTETDNDGDGADDNEPWEILTWKNDTDSPAEVGIFVLDDTKFSQQQDWAETLDTEFKLLWTNATLDETVGNGTLDQPTVFGHGLDGAVLVASLNADLAHAVLANNGLAPLVSADDESSRISLEDLFGGDADPDRTFLTAPDHWADGQNTLDGTVYSSAYLAALSALMFDQANAALLGLTDDDIIAELIDSTIDLHDAGVDVETGYGLVDPDAAFSNINALIPEPATGGLLLAAVALLAPRRRRDR